MGDRKIIFLDIDGTLTEPGKNIPPQSAQDAIAKARAKGHLVFLCTGRNLGMLSPVLEHGTYDGIVGSSGGYVQVGDKVIYDCPMTPEQKEKVLDVFERNGVYRTVECRDQSYTDESFKEFLRENSTEGGNSELLRWREAVESSLDIRPMAEYKGGPIYKLVFMARSEESLKEPEELLGDEFTLVIQGKMHTIINGELINKAFDKGQAVKKVAEYLNIPMEDTVGYGDSMNDLEMIEVVGHSVCMENGNEELKKISDEVCPSVTEDGLAKSFEMNGWA